MTTSPKQRNLAPVEDELSSVRGATSEEAARDISALQLKGASTISSTSDTEELRFLNEHHSFPLQEISRTQAPTTLVGRALALLKERVRRFLLGNYFIRESEYQARLVRHINRISEIVDTKQLRLSDDHWSELVASEQRLRDELSALRGELQQRFQEIQRFRVENEAKLTALDSVTKGLERILTQATASKQSQTTDAHFQSVVKAAEAIVPFDPTYVLLENRFRGSEDEISKRLADYPKMFSQKQLPILEVGAGRGELQRLFRSFGIASYALEIDSGMLAMLQGEGFDVRSEDVVSHLERLEAQSLGGIVAIQVVEHLPYEYLRRFFQEASRVIAPGGKFVFETINTASILALTQNYFRDPSHQAPMHPDTMRFLLEISGFEILDLELLTPFPESAKLQRLPVDHALSPRFRESIDAMNRNLDELNRLLFAHQDYRLLATPKSQGDRE